MASFFIYRRTPEGEAMYQQWQDFKNYLGNGGYHFIKGEVSEQAFYQYMIYGIAAGLNEPPVKKIANDLDINFPNSESHILQGGTATDYLKGEAIYQIAHAVGSAFNSSSDRSTGRSSSPSGGLGSG